MGRGTGTLNGGMDGGGGTLCGAELGTGDEQREPSRTPPAPAQIVPYPTCYCPSVAVTANGKQRAAALEERSGSAAAPTKIVPRLGNPNVFP
jgi:hypothetical protein